MPLDLDRPIDDPTDVRLPPHSTEAEQGLLGAILTQPRTLDQVVDVVRPEHFTHGAHAALYAEILRRSEAGRGFDPVTLKEFANNDPDLAEVGGQRYLAGLITGVVNVRNAPEYARIVADFARRRRLIEIGYTLVDQAFSTDIEETAEQIQEATEAELLEVAQSSTGRAETVHVSDAAAQALDQFEAAHKNRAPVGLLTGFADLDRRLGGIAEDEMVILAGRPSMGKSALGMAIAWSVSRAGLPADFYSAEMGPDSLAERMVSAEARVSLSDLKQGRCSDADFEAAVMARRAFDGLPLYIQDCAGITVGAIRSRARRMKRRHDIGLIVVDYLQILGAARGERSENRTQEVTKISAGLKAIAKELRVPVLVLSQLSRAVEQREDKRPQLADLRDSGSIEQDADKVMFVYRDEYYLERAEPKPRDGEGNDKYQQRVAAHAERLGAARNVMEVIVAKNRRGSVGTARLYFNAATQRIEDLAREDG